MLMNLNSHTNAWTDLSSPALHSESDIISLFHGKNQNNKLKLQECLQRVKVGLLRKKDIDEGERR